MIADFMDWCHDQPLGLIYFVVVLTFGCCTGLALIVLLVDVIRAAREP